MKDSIGAQLGFCLFLSVPDADSLSNHIKVCKLQI